MNKTLVTALAAVLALTPALSAQQAASAPSAPPQGVIVQKVLVRVNGEIYTQSDLEFEQIQDLRLINKNVSQPGDLLTNPALRAALAEVTPRILLKAVEELLWLQHGRELGIKFTDEMFVSTLADLKKANNIPDEATFQAVLKQEGMTMADLRMTIERNTIISGAKQRELGRNMSLTDEEMRQYYKAHPDEFRKAPTITLREIFVGVQADTIGGKPVVSVAAEEEAKAKIDAARARAVKGEDFAKLAAEVSESSTKASGGLIGTFELSDLSETISKVVENMKQGEISEPVRIRTGYQIIKVEARSTADVETFEKSRERIQARILDSRIAVEEGKFTDKLLAQAVIEWKDDGLRQLYEAARAASRAKQK